MEWGRINFRRTRLSGTIVAAGAVATLTVAPVVHGAVLCPRDGHATVAQSAPLLGDDVPIGCPLRTVAPQVVKLSVQVRKFCVANFPFAHDQVEFKLKVQVKNLGTNTIDIRGSHWRLLLSRMNPKYWHPPAHGGALGVPQPVSYRGYRVWSVPANANPSFDSSRNGEMTFASYWDGSDLLPGATYYRPANRQGDLAFYVPRRYVTLERNLIGLAYVTNGRARVVARYRNWRGRTAANDF